jgi:hypothetical protein
MSMSRSRSRSRSWPWSKYKVRVAAAGRRQARLSLSRSMMAGGGGHTGHMAHGTAHGAWETVDSRQSTVDSSDYRLHRAPYVAITITLTTTIVFAIHRRRPKREREREHPVLCFATQGRSGRLGTCTGCSFQAALCCPTCRRCLLPAACCPAANHVPCRPRFSPPPRLQPEETEAEDETRHVVSLQPPAHGDKRSTAPHRTAQNRPQRADSIRQRRPVPPMASPSSSPCQPSTIALSPTGLPLEPCRIPSSASGLLLNHRKPSIQNVILSPCPSVTGRCA